MLACTLRFIYNVRHPSNGQNDPLSVEEIDTARCRWIYACQDTSLSKEIHHLQTNHGKQMPIVKKLCWFLDKFGYLHCSGRIHNASVSPDVKFPYLMPKNHPLIRFLVYLVHQDQLHAGVSNTVVALRHHYRIPSTRQFVK